MNTEAPPIGQKFCDDFFSSIAPLQDAYVHRAFHYIAIRVGDDFQLINGRVFLNTTGPNPALPPFSFQSKNVRAGRYRVEELATDSKHLVNQLAGGALSTPNGTLKFSGKHSFSFTPFHQEGLRNQSRYNVLTIMGSPIEQVLQPALDWEIKAASQPYDGLQELLTELGLGGMNAVTASVEVVAFNVAGVDFQASKVSGRKADVHVLVAKSLDRNQVTLGLRVYSPGIPIRRELLPATQFEWSDTDATTRGHTAIDIPNAAVINCMVNYKGFAQHHQWLTDPNLSQNPRRAIYETFDAKLENLKGAIVSASGRGQDARQLEPAIAWLLWMLGFSVVHLGGTPRSRDAADLIAATPAGHIAVVECTTGLLKAENKLALLHARAEAVRSNLRASGNTYQRILPVIVTSRTAAEITPDVEAAERLGIMVVTREGIERGIDRTLIQPNAETVFAEAEQTVTTARRKYENEPTLPLNDTLDSTR